MADPKPLYDVLKRDKLYTKDFDSFLKDYSSKENRAWLYGQLVENEYVSKDVNQDKWISDWFGSTEQAPKPAPKTPPQTTPGATPPTTPGATPTPPEEKKVTPEWEKGYKKNMWEQDAFRLSADLAAQKAYEAVTAKRNGDLQTLATDRLNLSAYDQARLEQARTPLEAGYAEGREGQATIARYETELTALQTDNALVARAIPFVERKITEKYGPNFMKDHESNVQQLEALAKKIQESQPKPEAMKRYQTLRSDLEKFQADPGVKQYGEAAKGLEAEAAKIKKAEARISEKWGQNFYEEQNARVQEMQDIAQRAEAAKMAGGQPSPDDIQRYKTLLVQAEQFNADPYVQEYQTLSDNYNSQLESVRTMRASVEETFGAGFEAEQRGKVAEINRIISQAQNVSEEDMQQYQSLYSKVQAFQEDPAVRELYGMSTLYEKQRDKAINLLKEERFQTVADVFWTKQSAQEYQDQLAKKPLSAFSIASNMGAAELAARWAPSIAMRATGRFLASIGGIIQVADNAFVADNEYDWKDNLGEYLRGFSKDADLLFATPSNMARGMITDTAKWKFMDKDYQVDFDKNGNIETIRDDKGYAVDVELNSDLEKEIRSLPRTNQANLSVLPWKTAEVASDLFFLRAATGGIGMGMQGVGITGKYAGNIATTMAVAGQMSGSLYDQGLELFDGDKQKAAQFAAIAGVGIGAVSSFIGVEALAGGGKRLLTAAIKPLPKGELKRLYQGMTPAQAAARHSLQIGLAGAGEMVEETFIEQLITNGTSALLGGEVEFADWKENAETAAISFIVGAGAETTQLTPRNEMRDMALLNASQNPEKYAAALDKLIDNGWTPFGVEGPAGLGGLEKSEFVARERAKFQRLGAQIELLGKGLEEDKKLGLVRLLEERDGIQRTLDVRKAAGMNATPEELVDVEQRINKFLGKEVYQHPPKLKPLEGVPELAAPEEVQIAGALPARAESLVEAEKVQIAEQEAARKAQEEADAAQKAEQEAARKAKEEADQQAAQEKRAKKEKRQLHPETPLDKAVGKRAVKYNRAGRVRKEEETYYLETPEGEMYEIGKEGSIDDNDLTVFEDREFNYVSDSEVYIDGKEEPYQYAGVNKNQDGEVVSLNLVTPDGRTVTIRDKDFAQQVFEQRTNVNQEQEAQKKLENTRKQVESASTELANLDVKIGESKAKIKNKKLSTAEKKAAKKELARLEAKKEEVSNRREELLTKLEETFGAASFEELASSKATMDAVSQAQGEIPPLVERYMADRNGDFSTEELREIEAWASKAKESEFIAIDVQKRLAEKAIEGEQEVGAAEPTPTEPAPTEPIPAEPAAPEFVALTAPAPTEPMPAEPAASEPVAPTESVPAEPAAPEPVAPTEPVPAEPAPAAPAGSEPTEPEAPIQPAPVEPKILAAETTKGSEELLSDVESHLKKNGIAFEGVEVGAIGRFNLLKESIQKAKENNDQAAIDSMLPLVRKVYDQLVNTEVTSTEKILAAADKIIEQETKPEEPEVVEAPAPAPTTGFQQKYGVTYDEVMAKAEEGKNIGINPQDYLSGVYRDQVEDFDAFMRDFQREMLSRPLPKKLPTKKEKFYRDEPFGEVKVAPVSVNVKQMPAKTADEKAKTIAEITSKDNLSPALTGIFYSKENKQVVATDAHVLVTIDAPDVKETKLVDPKTNKDIDARFVDYKSVIPENPPIKRQVSVRELLNKAAAASRASKMFSNTLPILVAFKFSDTIIYINPTILEQLLTAFAKNGVETASLEVTAPHRALLLKAPGITGLAMPTMSEGENAYSVIYSSELTQQDKLAIESETIRQIDIAIEKNKKELEDAKKEKDKEYWVEYLEQKQKQLQADKEKLEQAIAGPDNKIQEEQDLQEINQAIEDGTITEEQAVKFIEQPIERSGEVESAVQAIESKAESPTDAQQAIREADKLIEGEVQPGADEKVAAAQSHKDKVLQAEKELGQALAAYRAKKKEIESRENPSVEPQELEPYKQRVESAKNDVQRLRKQSTKTDAEEAANKHSRGDLANDPNIKVTELGFAFPKGFGIALDKILTTTAQVKLRRFLENIAKYTFSPKGFMNNYLFKRNEDRVNYITGQMKQAAYVNRRLNKAIKEFAKKAKISEDLIRADVNEILKDPRFVGMDVAYLTSKNVNEDILRAAADMRNHIDMLSAEFITLGIADGDLAYTITDNLGVYLTRSYQVHDDKMWLEKVKERPAWAAAAVWMQKEVAAEMADLMEAKEQYAQMLWKAMQVYESTKGEKTKEKAVKSMLHWRAKIQAAEEAYAKLQDVFENKNGQLTARLERMVKEQMEGAGGGPANKSKLGSKDLGIFTKRKDIPKEIRDLFGEYEDPGVNYMKSIFKMIHLIENHKFLRDVEIEGVTEGWLSVDEREGMTDQIAAEGSKVMQPLNGYFTTEHLKKAFEEAGTSVGEYTGPILQTMVAVMAIPKIAKTLLSHVTQITNFVSNQWLMWMNGHYTFLPFDMIKAMNGAARPEFQEAWDLAWMEAGVKSNTKEREAKMVDLFERGVLGESITFGEIRDTLNAMQGFRDRFFKGEKVDAVMGKAEAFFETAQNFYQFGDNFWKILMYSMEMNRLAKLKKGQKFEDLSPDQQEEVRNMAAERAQNQVMNYRRIPRNVRLLGLALPVGTFVSFPWESVRTTKHAMLNMVEDMTTQTDYKVAGVPYNVAVGVQRALGFGLSTAGVYALQSAAFSFFGFDDEDRDDLKAFLPTWDSEAIILPLSKPLDGKFKYINLSRQMPHGYPLQVISILEDKNTTASQKATKLWDTATQPFFSLDIAAEAAYEAVTNRDIRSGEKIVAEGEETKLWFENRGGVPVPVGSGNWKRAALIYKAFEPGSITSARRVIQSLSEPELKHAGKLDFNTEILANATGTRVVPVDVNTSFRFLSNKLRDDKVAADNLYRLETKKQIYETLPPDEANARLEPYKRNAEITFRKVGERAVKLYADGIKLGGDPAYFEERLKVAGFTVAQVKDITSGVVPSPTYGVEQRSGGGRFSRDKGKGGFSK